MNKSEKFWNRFAKRYSKQAIANEDAYQKKLQITREHFTPDMELLEIGCGTGSTALIHAPHVKHIHAIDISSKMIAIAKEKAAAQNIKNITFEHLTIDQLKVNNQNKDMILALSILHLIENREEVIARIYSMLKPGGIFVSSTACLSDFLKPFKFIAPIGHALGLLPLVKIFSSKELEQEIRRAGFEIEYQWKPAKNEALFIVAKKPL